MVMADGGGAEDGAADVGASQTRRPWSGSVRLGEAEDGCTGRTGG